MQLELGERLLIEDGRYRGGWVQREAASGRHVLFDRKGERRADAGTLEDALSLAGVRSQELDH